MQHKINNLINHSSNNNNNNNHNKIILNIITEDKIKEIKNKVLQSKCRE